MGSDDLHLFTNTFTPSLNAAYDDFTRGALECAMPASSSPSSHRLGILMSADGRLTLICAARPGQSHRSPDGWHQRAEQFTIVPQTRSLARG